jgi:hypothetical protein
MPASQIALAIGGGNGTVGCLAGANGGLVGAIDQFDHDVGNLGKSEDWIAAPIRLVMIERSNFTSSSSVRLVA